MRATFGTGRRLFIAFALLVSIFALSSYVMLAHVRSIHDGLLETRRYEEGVRVSQELSSAVRDQYAHQAHTIILGNDSHLPLYRQAHAHVLGMIARVRRFAKLPDERAWVDDMATSSEQLDRVFIERIVPAVLEQHTADVLQEHARAQQLVSDIQDKADRLVDRFEASISDFQAAVASMQVAALRWNIFFVAVAPLLAALVGVYVHSSVARPVGRLQEGAARIARGELDARIQIDSPDEFGALAHQFNRMTQALKEHQARLVQQEKLAGIGRLAAGVAHEINNPLAVILGYARLLGRGAAGRTAADLQIIEDETLRAKAIVDGLLDLSRPTHVEAERVDLRALADEAIERLTAAKRLDGVTVTVTGAGLARGSAQKLQQVVMNLVQNAAEAAPGGRVNVQVCETPEFGEVIVHDTGPGLSREALERVFEPFFTNKVKGTGLGLAVSKGIVQAHGGTILASNDPVRGATFEVRLPPVPRQEVH